MFVLDQELLEQASWKIAKQENSKKSRTFNKRQNNTFTIILTLICLGFSAGYPVLPVKYFLITWCSIVCELLLRCSVEFKSELWLKDSQRQHCLGSVVIVMLKGEPSFKPQISLLQRSVWPVSSLLINGVVRKLLLSQLISMSTDDIWSYLRESVRFLLTTFLSGGSLGCRKSY